MAIEIGPIAKPHIFLVGNIIDSNEVEGTISANFAQRVEYAKHLEPSVTKVIGGVDQYDQENILTFDNDLRVIITGKVENKFTYFTKDNPTLPAKTFEGFYKDNSNTAASSVIGQYSETWFTINGKDPVRSKCYLYKYKDMDDANTSIDPSAENSTSVVNSYSDLGFILGACQTGSDLITIKAKTYYQGNESRIAVVKFKIARKQTTSTDIVNAIPIGN